MASIATNLLVLPDECKPRVVVIKCRRFFPYFLFVTGAAFLFRKLILMG